MKKHVSFIVFISAMLVLVSCVSHPSDNSPYMTLTNDAIRQFAQLRDAGNLPGLTRDEHGQLETEVIPQSENVAYPVSVVLHVKVEKDQSRLSYTFIKESKTSEWRLVKAWRTKADGLREDLKVN
jgi:hypothetical protein